MPRGPNSNMENDACDIDCEFETADDVKTDSSQSSISCSLNGSPPSSGFLNNLLKKEYYFSSVEYFGGFDPDSNGHPKKCDTSKCKLCLVCVMVKWENTSNLFNHL